MDQVGWGVLGSGDVIDRKSGDSFRTIPRSRLVCVMRRSADKAREAARRHGASSWTTDPDELIAHPNVSAVYIATPPEHHLEYALAVCAAGKACVVEKPAGRSDRELERMLEAFRAAGLPLFVSYYRRHVPKFRRTKEILDSGVLGTITSIDYRLSKPLREDGWRLDPKQSGGGQFYDLSGHVLDLLDFWFGPLELTGSSASNSVPRYESEDAVALSFRTAGGAVGTALWNFTATRRHDELVVEGHKGCLRLACMSTSSPVFLQLADRGASRWAPRWLPARGKTYRFAKVKRPHRPMLEAIVEQLTAKSADVASAEAALRTSRIANRALGAYYGGRRDDFWERPGSWQSQRARAARRLSASAPQQYALSDEQVRRYQAEGYVGPFRCDADWERVPVPARSRDLHLTEPLLFDLCTHPSIVDRVAQAMGTPRIALFKSRFVVKPPGSRKVYDWHQDIGERNGGYLPNGEPVETATVWLALDEVDAGNGAVQILPGSHRRAIGDPSERIKKVKLLERGALSPEEARNAVTLEMKGGEFYLIHSWLLHASGPNNSTRRRAGYNIRYARQGEEHDPEFVYFPLECTQLARARSSRPELNG